MSLLSKSLHKTEKWIASKVPHTTQQEKRDAMTAVKEQIDYYKTAKEDIGKARTQAEEEKKAERKRINETEIRSRQRHFRRGGFLETPAVQPQETLG